MATASQPSDNKLARPRAAEQLPAIRPPRLPYHPEIEKRFGIDKASWKALVEAIFPTATSTESIILALSYCRARKLDPFKRVVHIVPIYNKDQRCYVDTIWPGIGELRTTAFRTGEYAGRGETRFGDDVTQEWPEFDRDGKQTGTVEVTYPEWAQVTVRRMVKGTIVHFAGPRVIEHAEIVSEPTGRYLRYLKAMPTGKVCLACHGPVEQMSEAVKAQIANEYPHDRAVGFAEGSIRGAISVKKPL